MARMRLPIAPTPGREDGAEAAGLPAAGEHAMSSPPAPACASCKHQRKRCGPTCFLAPYFPPGRAEDFRCVYRVFGVSNATKRLKSLRSGEEREMAAEAMVWEAKCWLYGDPILGAFGRWRAARDEAEALRRRMQHCMTCRGRNATGNNSSYGGSDIDAAAAAHHDVYDGRRPLFTAVQQNYQQPQFYPFPVDEDEGLLQLPGILPRVNQSHWET